MNRTVTERDFRKTEFVDANPEDYEFRADGSIARKDRWERGIRSIMFAISSGRGFREFEIDNLVTSVEWLMSQIPDRGLGHIYNEHGICTNCGHSKQYAERKNAVCFINESVKNFAR